MKLSKQNHLAVGFAVILLIVVFSMAIISFTTKPRDTLPAPTPAPDESIDEPLTEDTTLPTRIPTALPVAIPLSQLYDKNAQEILLAKVTNRASLSDEDLAAKARILARLPAGQESGVLYESENIVIDYTHSADIFQVQIVTPSVKQAKTEGNNWFLTQGVSQQGICDLPVEFFLGFDTQGVIIDTSASFSPLADPCLSYASSVDFLVSFERLMAGQGRNTVVLGDEESFVSVITRYGQGVLGKDKDAYLHQIYKEALSKNLNPLAIVALWGAESSFSAANAFNCSGAQTAFDQQLDCATNTLNKLMQYFDDQAQRHGLPVPNEELPTCTYNDPFVFAYEKYNPACSIGDKSGMLRKNFVTYYRIFLGEK